MVHIFIGLSEDVDNKEESMKCLTDYVDNALLKHVGLPNHFEQTEDGVKISCERDIAKAVILRMLEDYTALGYNLEIPVDLYSIYVYCSDPFLQSMFLCERMNIDRIANDASAEYQAQSQVQLEDLETTVSTIDTLHTLNGTYKMRKILNVLIKALEKKGIFVSDEINECFVEQIH